MKASTSTTETPPDIATPARTSITAPGSRAAPGPATFRPPARRRNRIAVGLVLGALAICGNLLAYASLDERDDVVQVTTNIPAGTRITPDMVRVVEVAGDPSLTTVPAEEMSALIGQHARVHIVSGSLISRVHVQPTPLVGDGKAVVAVQISQGALPAGVREQVAVRLVVPAPPTIDPTSVEPTVVDGIVTAVAVDETAGRRLRSISVELDPEAATLIAAADDVRIVRLPHDPTDEVRLPHDPTDEVRLPHDPTDEVRLPHGQSGER